MARPPKSFCELCEMEFQPRTQFENDIVCPKCNTAEVRRTRSFHGRLYDDNTRRTTGLIVHRPHTATDADYQAMLVSQGGRCAICATQPHADSLVIDHNHRNGKVRGLLCQDCNKGIGCLGDHPTILQKAMEYLAVQGYYGAYPRPPEAVRVRGRKAKAS